MPALALAGRRHRLLRAIGVNPYQLRTRSVGAAAVSPAHRLCCVLVLPAGCPERALAVLERALGQLGGGVLASVPRVVVAAGKMHKALPKASAYLAFGAAQAAAVEQCLGPSPAPGSRIVAVDAPDALLGAEGKRRLWEALQCVWERSQNESASV